MVGTHKQATSFFPANLNLVVIEDVLVPIGFEMVVGIGDTHLLLALLDIHNAGCSSVEDDHELLVVGCEVAPDQPALALVDFVAPNQPEADSLVELDAAILVAYEEVPVVAEPKPPAVLDVPDGLYWVQLGGQHSEHPDLGLEVDC